MPSLGPFLNELLRARRGGCHERGRQIRLGTLNVETFCDRDRKQPFDVQRVGARLDSPPQLIRIVMLLPRLELQQEYHPERGARLSWMSAIDGRGRDERDVHDAGK